MNPVTSTASGIPESNQAQGKADAAARWRKLVERQRDSGLSVSAFCREQGLTASSLFAWRRRLSGGRRGGRAKFVEVRGTESACGEPVEPAAHDDRDGPIELRLRGDRRLVVQRGFDRDLLVELVRTLEGMS